MAEDKVGATARTAESSPQQFLNLVVERAQHAQRQYETFFRKMMRWYDLYRGCYSGRYQNFRNNIHIPFLFASAQSDVARKVQTSFGSWPIVGFAGYAPEDAAMARKNEVLISAQMKDCGSFAKAVDLFLTADLYGTGIAMHCWRRTVRKERWREVNEFTNSEMVLEGDVVRFDGPDWYVIDPLDFWPQPGKKRIDDADWVIYRYYRDLDWIADMADQGVFDKSAVTQLREAPLQGQQEAQMQERLSVYRSWTEFEAQRAEKFAKPVEIWEMWGSVPSDMAPGGIRQRVISVANRRVMLRNRPNPYWHGKKPFLAFSPNPDPHFFHGTAKAEVAEKPQVAANRLANQKLDALDLFIDPVFIANRQAGIDFQNLYLRAGRVIGVDGPVDDTQIKPITPDLRGMQQAYAEIGQLSSWIQQGTGIVEDTVAGLPGNRETARGYLGRQEAALTRLMLEARLAEEEFVEPLADMFRALDRQYLTLPHQVEILGSAATINPITGLPMPQEQTVINLADINRPYRARAYGASQMLGKAVRQQNLIAVLQAVSAMPGAIQSVNWAAMLRQVFEAFDMRNPDELLVTQPTMLNQQAAMMAGGGPAAPGAEANGGGGGVQQLPQLNPEIIGALLGSQPNQPLGVQ